MPNKKRKHSAETKAKISASMTGENNHRFGTKLTDDHLKALAEGRSKAQAEGRMGRPFLNPMVTLNGKTFRLDHRVRTETFNGITTVNVNSELNPNGYYNYEWFAKRNITVIINPN